MTGQVTYALLLDLCRGKASVVERMTPAERAAVRVETPLMAYVDEAARSGNPRHIVLTGNAGDGKTFTALQAAAETEFQPILDASAVTAGEGASDPVAALAADIARCLGGGRRVLLAINRGQLERLSAHARQAGDPDLTAFVDAAVRGAALKPRWEPDTADEAFVAAVDLGLFDTTHHQVMAGVLDRALTVDLAGVSPEVRAATEAAREALRSAGVRGWVSRAVQETTARGGHLTMRDLWTLVAFLLTGQRAADSGEPATIGDSVGHRLFSCDLLGGAEEVMGRVDPALRPEPALARAILADEAAARAIGLPGLGGLRLDGDGRALLRSLVVHDEPRTPPPADDQFLQLVSMLTSRDQGWCPLGAVTTSLLKGVYRALDLWHSTSFPAWQTLCYDARLYEGGVGSARRPGAVALGEINQAGLRLAIPRPSPAAARALGAAWRPPYVWLAFEGAGGSERGALRLTPRLFRTLNKPDARDLAALPASDRMTLARWLGSAPRSAVDDAVRLYGPGDQQPLVLAPDPLEGEGKHRLQWEAPR